MKLMSIYAISDCDFQIKSVPVSHNALLTKSLFLASGSHDKAPAHGLF
jgi:hypothetical protein